MNRLYLLSFDPHKTDANGLHQAIKNNQLFIDWWHFLASTYILVTQSDINKVATDIQSKWPNQQFLIVEINPRIHYGWLPKDAWDWINKYK